MITHFGEAIELGDYCLVPRMWVFDEGGPIFFNDFTVIKTCPSIEHSSEPSDLPSSNISLLPCLPHRNDEGKREIVYREFGVEESRCVYQNVLVNEMRRRVTSDGGRCKRHVLNTEHCPEDIALQ
eukprot:scaffold305_cov267-Chaetoceros_neogracile.AAC.10